jgi:hypothetical protein
MQYRIEIQGDPEGTLECRLERRDSLFLRRSRLFEPAHRLTVQRKCDAREAREVI